MRKAFQRLQKKYGFIMIDGTLSIPKISQELKKRISQLLLKPPLPMAH